jgi:hypothetical protein
MKRREFITLLGGTTAAWPFTAHAHKRGKLATIGYFGAADRYSSALISD